MIQQSIGKPFKSGILRFLLAAEPHPLTPEERSAAAVKAWDTRGRTERGTTTVGITSQRPDAEAKPNRLVFQQMQQFADRLRAIPTLTNVRVQPGLGMWEDPTHTVRQEGTWVVSYRGDGAARRLLAQTGKRYNQDAVLITESTTASDPAASPSVEFEFDTPLPQPQQQALTKLVVEKGMSGATWFKRGGKTMLRAVAVPQWGDDPTKHLASAQAISANLTQRGLTHRVGVSHVKVEVMEKNGDHAYDNYLQAEPAPSPVFPAKKPAGLGRADVKAGSPEQVYRQRQERIRRFRAKRNKRP